MQTSSHYGKQVETLRTTRTRKRGAYLFSMVCAVLFALFSARAALPDPPAVGVMYPKIRQPYRGVFLSIVEGIEAQLGTSVKRHALPERYSTGDLNDWLKKESVGTVIALGSRGLRAAAQLPDDVQVVAGAVLNAPEDASFPVVTLHPDPGALFDELQRLAPGVTRIAAVYNPQRTGWLMEGATGAAKERGLALNLVPATGLREAVLKYRDLLKEGDAGKQAIWLLQDPTTTDARTVLPLILKEAWNRNLVVFSSSPAYVRRGVLFALYPDNVDMGRTLGELARKGRGAGSLKVSGALPLRDLLTAVNVRTADHLGLELTSRQKRAFDLVFPSP